MKKILGLVVVVCAIGCTSGCRTGAGIVTGPLSYPVAKHVESKAQLRMLSKPMPPRVFVAAPLSSGALGSSVGIDLLALKDAIDSGTDYTWGEYLAQAGANLVEGVGYYFAGKSVYDKYVGKSADNSTLGQSGSVNISGSTLQNVTINNVGGQQPNVHSEHAQDSGNQ